MALSNLLDSIRSAVSLTATEATLVQDLFREQHYKKDSFFLAEAQVCRQVGFIAEGLIRYCINDEGEDKTYGFGMEGNFVCNYESFIPQVPSTKIIQALEDSTLLTISYEGLQRFYKEITNGERFGRMVIEQVFIQTLGELSSFYTDSPELRYKKFLEQYPALQQRISQYYIASYVGVQPQSLSRIRKRMLGKR
jgi:CRP-like cAMP-binding protein